MRRRRTMGMPECRTGRRPVQARRRVRAGEREGTGDMEPSCSEGAEC